jgi:hypothetical protein
MKPKTPRPEQDDLLRARLVEVNFLGRVSFARMLPGIYVKCEELLTEIPEINPKPLRLMKIPHASVDDVSFAVGL